MSDIVSWSGLIVYILSVLGGLVTLLYDGHRFVTGQQTITQWATQKPAREWGLVGAIATGVVGVAAHFLFFAK